MSLRELYQEMILDHGREPRNFGVLKTANHSHLGYNPLCGDKITLYLFCENDVIVDVCFEGSGCAIAIASASLMSCAVKGKTITEFQALFDGFHLLVTQGKKTCDLGKLDVLAGVSEFPVRVKCATLAWHTLKAALSNDVSPVRTE
jgi:nitrogen fixation protein NifU and related proteins